MPFLDEFIHNISIEQATYLYNKQSTYTPEMATTAVTYEDDPDRIWSTCKDMSPIQWLGITDPTNRIRTTSKHINDKP